MELRFMIDSMVQAYYIDLHHSTASLEMKLEVFKALSEYQGFIASKLINKSEFTEPEKNKLKALYNDLSNYAHPSHKECLEMMRYQSGNINLEPLVLNDYIDVVLKKLT